jgi:hypothetical protein
MLYVYDVGWKPAEPTEARKPLEPAWVWNPDELDVTTNWKRQYTPMLRMLAAAFCHMG